VREHGSKDEKLLLSKWPFEYSGNYLDWVNEPTEEEAKELDKIRNSINRGSPYGKASWVKRIAEKFRLQSALNSREGQKKVLDPFSLFFYSRRIPKDANLSCYGVSNRSSGNRSS
jgi:hypothetical protein